MATVTMVVTATVGLDQQPNGLQQPTSPSGANGGSQPIGVAGNLSLYVGDLDLNVTDGQLYDLFSKVAPVLSVRVCRDQTRYNSLGYGYVNFGSPEHAANAMEVLNNTPLNGKLMRIMYSHRDPSLRKSGKANLFIKNLDASIDNKGLYDTFAAFGTILSCKVEMDNNGRSKGYGYVQYEDEESAQNVITSLNGMLLNDKQVYVGHHVRRQERIRANGSPKFTNVYVKNLSDNFGDEDLLNSFTTYGSVTSAVVMKDESGKSKCFGFVNFQSPDSAAAAVEKLNETVHDDKVWYVARAQRKAEREAELKAKFEQDWLARFEKLQAANLYLKNLDDSINEEKLKELFSDFGTIKSCKVMLDHLGVSKGSGFVSFSTPEEAAAAISEMNGKMVLNKPLYVAIAQRKDERKAKLQAHFSQVRLQGGMSPLPPGMPAFHPGAGRLTPPPFYFGQGAPSMLPPHLSGYGFQQQILPGIRPGITPNFMVPFQVPRQGQRHPGRRGGNGQHFTDQQMPSRNGGSHGFRYVANGRNGTDSRPIMSMPLDAAGFSMTASVIARSGPMSMASLASSLAAAPPDSQRVMLGEQLYPLVERLEHDNAGKVTGMLLEMDQTEVLHLIESPDSLKKKVAEAMLVLQSATGGSEVGA